MTITTENFSDIFNLDFAFALTDGLSNIDHDSACVAKLVAWCADRGYEISCAIAYDVLVSQIECQTNR